MIEDFRDETVRSINSYADELQDLSVEIDKIKDFQCWREFNPSKTTIDGDYCVQEDLEDTISEYNKIDSNIYTEYEESISLLGDIEDAIEDARIMLEEAFNKSDPN
jgi:hypothetical protein